MLPPVARRFLPLACLLAAAGPVLAADANKQAAAPPRPQPLWPNGAPGAVGKGPADVPSVTVYLPPADKATGRAVVTCPGRGHLASTAGTHFDDGRSDAPDPIDRLSCRPDFLILLYPVISFTAPYTHKGSRTNLLGKSPDAALVASLSNETQVTARTPPTFLA